MSGKTLEQFSPGSTIGIFGGGQLGRMMIQSGRSMGYRFHVYDPSELSTAGFIADSFTCASYDDTEALDAFAASVDLITLEFENIAVLALEHVSKTRPVMPGIEVLRTCQDRALEKTFLSDNEIAVAPFKVAQSPDELAEAIKLIGTPCVVKSARSGYDGKSQLKLDSFKVSQMKKVWDTIGADTVVVEQWIPHIGEFSAICARRSDGATRLFPMMRNLHRNHILAETHIPCGLDPQIEQAGQRIARKIAEALDVVGLIAVEFFLTSEQKLLVNELAPRPHNSGHATMDACYTSQFQQHIRAICGLPLGNPRLHTHAKMINLLGDRWEEGEPDWFGFLKDPNARLHLYDKGEPRPGRKMGHVTYLQIS